MKEEVKRWWDVAKEDYDTAKFNFEGEDYRATTFLCQQSVEKALKAFMLKKSGKIRKIHDLVELGKNADLPSEFLNEAKQLTLAYIYARYPDIEEVRNLNKIVKKFLKASEEILKWVKKQL